MKIRIPKSGLALSLIAPLCLQWVRMALDDDPNAGVTAHVNCGVHDTLIDLYRQQFLDDLTSFQLLGIIDQLVIKYGGIHPVTIVLDEQPTYCMFSTHYEVSGTTKLYTTYNTIYTDGNLPG